VVSTQKLQGEIQKLLECIEGTAAVHASRRVMKREKVEGAAPPLRQSGIRSCHWHTKLHGEIQKLSRCTKVTTVNRCVMKWENFEAMTLACVAGTWIENTLTLFYVESFGSVR